MREVDDNSPVDDDVEEEEGEEGKDGGGADPGPGGVPENIILNILSDRTQAGTCLPGTVSVKLVSHRVWSDIHNHRM